MDWVYSLSMASTAASAARHSGSRWLSSAPPTWRLLCRQQIRGDQLNAIVDLAFTYPEFAVAIKRAHDRNLPLWLLGIFFATNVVLDLFTVIGLDRHR